MTKSNALTRAMKLRQDASRLDRVRFEMLTKAAELERFASDMGSPANDRLERACAGLH